MDSQTAITILRRHQDVLRSRGVRHAALFGSVAHGDAQPDSGVDIFIELAPDNTLDLFAYAGVGEVHREPVSDPGRCCRQGCAEIVCSETCWARRDLCVLTQTSALCLISHRISHRLANS
ncbi:MAG: nucleotidyltransferase family protein [Pseudolabrys sp.]